MVKNSQKTCKKVLTRYVRCGIIYKSMRYGTETKAKVARHLKFVLSKLNIEPIKKANVRVERFLSARPSQINFF